MIELENDIFIDYNPTDCALCENIARVHFKWQKISFLDDGSTGMLHHALLVQRKHSQDPGSECFWSKTFYWSTHCPKTPTVGVLPQPFRDEIFELG